MVVPGIVYVFMGFVVRDWSGAAEFTNYGGPTEGLTTIGHLIIQGHKVTLCH